MLVRMGPRTPDFPGEEGREGGEKHSESEVFIVSKSIELWDGEVSGTTTTAEVLVTPVKITSKSRE